MIDVIENYANADKVRVTLTFDDAFAHTDNLPYGVETRVVAGGHDSYNCEWFATQREQEAEYIRVVGEVSRGEWI